MSDDKGKKYGSRYEYNPESNQYEWVSYKPGNAGEGKLLQNLDLKVGDVVRCVKAFTPYFTVGKDYRAVMFGSDPSVSVLDDQGDEITTTSSKFVLVKSEKTVGGSDLLSQRKKTHGTWKDVSFVSQSLQSVIEANLKSDLTQSQKEALQMICAKMGRIVSGDANFLDHWDDIAGYATLAKNGDNE